MRGALLALAFLWSGPITAQDADGFDPGGYVQVELILFTRESQAQGANRTGVPPERLQRQAPRRFPAGIVGVRDAHLAVRADTSWFDNEWALLEPQLIDLSEEELVLGLLPVVEEDVLEEIFEEGEIVPEAAEAVASTQPGELEALQEAEEIPLWLRYRNWYTDLIANCFTQIAEEERKLAAALRAIDRSSELTVIMHGAWIQPIGARPQAVLLHGGEEGEVGVLNLRRQAFVQAEVRMWHPLAEGYAELRQTRPMRLARAYYFDHPMIGVILRVDPISVPLEFR